MSAPYPGTTVPRIIEKLLALPDEYKEETEKRNCWIRHFIESNYADKDKMCFIFEALTEVSIKQTTEYVALLVKCTKEYDIFKAIPLTPCSYSTFGSCVPLYSAWVEHLEELLQFLHGVDYIEHRTRVEELIRYYRKSIKEEEISEILRG